MAVVTAFDDATAEADMGTYRSEYGIPACTTANGCFSKVDENGGTSYPSPGTAFWDLTVAESLDMISAVCPNCHILLVEANSTMFVDLGPAEDEAVALGAKFVQNTWFTTETSSETADDAYFDHPGVAITAPDGNGSGYGTYYPAASPYVIAVGGTALTAASGTVRGWTDTASSQTSSGCSPYEAKPSWQTDPDCTGRMLNDVSAVADTNTPVALYDTTNGGWVSTGGTDIAASIVAAGYALAGTPAAGTNPASYPYAHTGQINDITTGSDGTCAPAPAYYCTAETGYDGPSGVGTPASAAAFGAQAPAESLASGPLSYSMGNGSMEVTAVGRPNGTVFVDSWTAAGGWSGWQNLGGDLSAPVTETQNPLDGALEVYGTGTNGTAFVDEWRPAGGWTGWTNLGGTFAGALTPVYDPADGALEVYGTGTNGTAFVDEWRPAGGWTGWTNLGGTFAAGSLTPIFNPLSGSVQVFGTGTSGTAFVDSWTPAGGWTGWTNLGGTFAGALAPAFNPVSGSVQVFGTGTSGTAFAASWTSAGGWSAWQNLGGTFAAGALAPAFNPVSQSVQVFGTGTSGTAFVDSWTSAGGWSAWQNLGGTFAAGALAPAFNPVNGSMQVVGTGTSGTAFVDSWTSAGGWSAWQNLGGTFSGL